MKRGIKCLLAALVVSLSLAAPVLAGSFEDGVAAYERTDYETALRIFGVEAVLGNAAAQSNLGVMFETGLGTPSNFRLAVTWYQKAAEQGHADGQRNLGKMYALGIGLLEDYVIAHMWFNLAAARGAEDAVKFRDRLSKDMTPAQIAEAQRLAREWKPKK